MKQYCRLRRQSGHAAILFALFIPLLFGVFTLGTDGARAVQDKARLLEAVEVTSLAVAGQGSDNAALAKNYLEYYFPSATINNNDIQIKKINCEDNANCKNTNRRFFEYQVSAKISQPTWFPGNDAIIGFGENYAVAGHSSARKFHAETVDVVLVADFSASMYDTWKGGSKRKFRDLKDILVEIADELEKFNGYKVSLKQNKLAIVGFDFYSSRRGANNQRIFSDHLICSDSSNTEIRCDSRYPGNDYRLNYSGAKLGVNINAQATIRDVFNMNSIAHQPVVGTVTNISVFENITLSENMDSIKTKIKSNSFNITQNGGSGTSSYAGLIRGAQIAKDGKNPRRIIIILSDGQDSFWKTTDKLINPNNPGSPPETPQALGLCNKIINELNAQKTEQGDPIKARMVAVGFDYNMSDFPQLKNCVGKENVFFAQNRDDIKNKILELITEEIGHLAL